MDITVKLLAILLILSTLLTLKNSNECKDVTIIIIPLEMDIKPFKVIPNLQQIDTNTTKITIL